MGALLPIVAVAPSVCVTAELVRQPISEAAAAEVVPLFKALADPVRLRLMSLIGSYGGRPVCVCDLAAGFDLAQSTISHHLKVLRTAGLVDSERRGTWVYYWIVPAAMERLSDLLSIAHPAAEGVPV